MADGPAGLRLSRQYTVDKKGTHSVGGSLPETMAELMPAPFVKMMKLFSGSGKPKGPVYEQYCTALPIGTALAHIRCGRNFEYFSEDPLISGKFAAAITRGVQRHPGRGTTLKHFAANSQETNRYNSNSRVSERALREIYLRGFEIAVRESRPRAVMTSYNLINGVHTSERRDLIENILRAEFGFDGVVMTDWIVGVMSGKGNRYAAPDAAKIAAAGNDLTMPGSQSDFRAMLRGLKNGTLKRRQLRVNATRVSRMARMLTSGHSVDISQGDRA